jgi:acyl-CoA thioesterase I
MPSTCDSCHRLGSHSRLRRWIILRQAGYGGDGSVAPAAARSREILPQFRDLARSTAADSDGAQNSVGFLSIRRLIAGSQPVTWIFAGDSITQGARHTDGQRSYCEHFAERVRGGLCRHDDVVINTSVPAETSRSLLEDFEWRTLRFRPDVVSVMIGSNDALAGNTSAAEFRRNLQHVVECIRAERALVLLHTPPGIDEARVASQTDLQTYVRVIRDMSRALNVPCVDHWAFWTKAASAGRNVNRWLAADGLHPTAQGHRILANLLLCRLGILREAARR